MGNSKIWNCTNYLVYNIHYIVVDYASSHGDGDGDDNVSACMQVTESALLINLSSPIRLDSFSPVAVYISMVF